MSTLWEMAETIRAEEMMQAQKPTSDVLSRGARPTRSRDYRGTEQSIDVRSRDRLDYWCKLLGTTPSQLYSAVAQVGQNPSVIRRFLVSRLAPTKMRA
jgi:uncharacterized protein DUF3606